jgi:hypothetical protein
VKTRLEKAQVATISAHNDSAIGDLVADAMEKVGGEGVISVEESKTMVAHPRAHPLRRSPRHQAIGARKEGAPRVRNADGHGANHAIVNVLRNGAYPHRGTARVVVSQSMDQEGPRSPASTGFRCARPFPAPSRKEGSNVSS